MENKKENEIKKEEIKNIENKNEKTLGEASVEYYNKVVRKEALKDFEREM